MKLLEEAVGGLLRERKLTLATAESATGGLLSALIVNVPGSSDYFVGGMVACSPEAKQRLGVKRETLEQYGAVSPQTGVEMAEGVRRLLGADLGLSHTGLLGPASHPSQPLGLGYIGLASPQGTRVRQCLAPGHPQERRRRAAREALKLLQEHLQQDFPALEERHVVTCFLEHRGRLALLRRSQRVGSYPGRWAGISGYLEEGNTPYEQALQELGEEAGLGPEDLRLVKEGPPLEAIDEGLGRRWVVHPFRFQLLSPEKLTLDWEHTELRWVKPEEIAAYETVPRLAETWERVA